MDGNVWISNSFPDSPYAEVKINKKPEMNWEQSNHHGPMPRHVYWAKISN